MSSLTKSSEWFALEAHAATLSQTHLRDLFANEPNRFDRFSRLELNLLFDFSRQRVTAETLALLTPLAEARGLRARIDAMFADGFE